MNRRSKTVPMLLLIVALIANRSLAEEKSGFDSVVQPFFKTYCLRCHDEQKQEGKFRLDTLPKDFADQAVAQRWARSCSG